MSDQQLNGQRLKIFNCRSFSFFRILTGCRPFSHSVNNKVVCAAQGDTLYLKIWGGGGRGWLSSLGYGILVGKRYFGVLQKY